MDDTDAQSTKYNAPALSKGLDILELLAGQNKGMKKSEIAKEMDRSVSEIFRMLAVLTERGYIALDTQSESYSLTPRLFEIAHRNPPIRRLNAVAGEIMEELADKLHQSIHLAVLHGTDILIVAQTDPQSNNVTSVRLGARVPILLTASGAVLTSQFSPKKREALIERIENYTPEQLKNYHENLKASQENLFCESPSSVIAGVHNISVPIYSVSGEIIAALTIPFVNRLHINDDPSIEEARIVLVDAGRRMSELIGAPSSPER